ncbi:MAG TPA: TatD family hydrolase [Tepidiformaceae bacterium]
MTLFDTHSHIQEESFRDDFEQVLRRAEAAGVVGITVCGYDAPSNLDAFRLSEDRPLLSPAVGFHPHDAKDVSASMLRELEAQAMLEQVVAVGEIGLDFYRDHSPQDVQRRVLDAQLEIAVRAGKPVSVHSRGAEGDLLPHLEEYARHSPLSRSARPPGVMHCFGGTLEQAQRYVDLGFLISIACSVTYPKSDETRRIAAELPLSVLVLETDSPYLPPQGMRGQRNEPSRVGAAAQAVAQARGLSPDRVAAETTSNAARLFGLPVPAPAVAS